jgi:magnesium transporter
MIIYTIKDAALSATSSHTLKALPTLLAIAPTYALNATIPHPKIPSHKDDPDAWSSLIGIITAICGNVLISIALNTQRYAHIRLHQQWEHKRKLLKTANRRRRRVETGGNGSVERRSTGQGAQLDGAKREQQKPRSGDGTNGQAVERDEMAPLLGRRSTAAEEEDIFSGETEEDITQKSYLKSPLWWAGIILMVLGEGGNFLAYGFAPASIVSPLGVVAIISNCIIAPFFMKERFRFRDFVGVLISVAGAVTVVLSASENNPKLGPHEIWDLITRWEFETYLVATSVVIVGLMLASNTYGQKSIFIDIGLVGLFGKSSTPMIHF